MNDLPMFILNKDDLLISSLMNGTTFIIMDIKAVLIMSGHYRFFKL